MKNEKNIPQIELLSPAGDMEKLETALYFGANAVYFSGKNFGLRAFAGNFSNDEILTAVEKCHEKKAKAYVTVNIIAKDPDFYGLEEYLKFLESAGVDGVIVADIGVVSFVRKKTPNLSLHISTQANVINSYSANVMAEMGAKRIVLARELSLEEIRGIRKNTPPNVELETFVHGAMCISYSGRCLLSNYLTGRDSNRGACVQACRWEYLITEKSRNGDKYEIQEDEKGTYILNSKDLSMIDHLEELIDAGVTSFKIEGRMKSPYYVATVTNAYRRKIDEIMKKKRGEKLDETYEDFDYQSELEKTSHRSFTTGFYFGANDKENLESSMPVQTATFIAVVKENAKDGSVKIEMRNAFEKGDILEVLSPNATFGKSFRINKILTETNEEVDRAKNVQETLTFYTDIPLRKGDILRKNLKS